MQRRSLKTTRQKDKYISQLHRSQRKKRETDHIRIMIERVSKAQRRKFKKLILTQHMSSKKENDEHHERAKKRSDQRLQTRTLKWRRELFIHQWILSCIACFSQHLQDKDEATWQWQEVMRMKRARIFTQLLNTISHDWKKSHSLFHCQRRRVRQVLMQALRWWFIACAAWCINSWRWREAEFIMQSCFFTKQCSHLRACSMRAQHMWIVAAFRWWTQRQHQIVWSLQFIMHQQLLKHAEIDMHIKNHEFSFQCKKHEESRRSRCCRRCSDDDVTKNVHFKKTSRLRKHVSVISVSANVATYHDDDDNDVDTAMSFMLAHKLTCITTMLQRKKLISWVASYARYA